MALTFALYSSAQGGTPLWLETQNVVLDEQGRYTVLLGSTTTGGLPVWLFATAEAQWLGIRLAQEGESEQPRVALVSVPYALAAADAHTLNGRPMTDFQLTRAATQASGDAAAASVETSGTVNSSANTVNRIAKFTATDTLGDSLLFDNGSNVGVGMTSPLFPLDVNGSVNAGGYLIGGNLFALSNNNQMKIYSGTSGTVIYDNAGGVQYGTFSSTGLSVAGRIQGDTFNAITGFSLSGNLFAISNNNQTKFFSGSGGTIIYDVTGATPLGHFTNTGLAVTGGVNATTVNAGSAFSLGGNLFAIFNNNQLKFFSGSGGTIIFDNTGGIPLGTFTTGGLAVTGALSSSQSAAGASSFSVASPPPYAVRGDATSAAGVTAGVLGITSAPLGRGVLGESLSTTGQNMGVYGVAVNSPDGSGVWGEATNTSGDAVGVFGRSSSNSGTGVFGEATATNGDAAGVAGVSRAAGGTGVQGEVTATTGENYGVAGRVFNSTNTASTAGMFINTGSGNLVTGRISAASGAANVFRIDTTGKGFFNGGTQTGGADFAESVSVKEEKSEYQPGDVIAIDTTGVRRFTKVSQPYSTLVAGIYSTKPGVLATPHATSDPRIERDEIPLAVLGIVPCKVTNENGTINAGDLLVASSRAGYAMKGTDRKRMTGAVIGKALQTMTGISGVIEVLVSLQ